MFKRRVTWLAAALLLPLLSSCPVNMLVVPVRICVIQGATFAPADQPVNLAAVTDKAHQIVAAASQIWRDSAEIGLLPFPDVRVMTDPNPVTTGRQKVGDIVQDIGIGQGPSQESDDVIKACEALWASTPEGKPPGVTLVFARDFASSDGGVNLDLLGYTPPPGKTQCTKPYNIDPDFVRARWSIVKTYISADQTPDMWLKQVSHTTAHELGHLMLLGHGNGKDDNTNGPWDEECDGAEYQQFDLVDPQAVGNLMHRSSALGTSLSPIQRELARAVAMKLMN